MMFIFALAVTIVSAIVHLLVSKSIPRTKKRVVEVFLLYFLGNQWGFVAVLSSLNHIVAPDNLAIAIGWQTGSPFQIELGFASLGLALLGVLSIWLRGLFWIAPVVGKSVFLWGAAYVHILDLIENSPLNPGRLPVLFTDIVVPVIVISLLFAHIRMGGMKSSV